MEGKFVTIEEAQKLQNEGNMVPNPKFGKHPDEPAQVFKASYSILWRPELATEDGNREYAIATEV